MFPSQTHSAQNEHWASLRFFYDNAVFICSLIFVFSIPWENAIPIPGIGTISRALGLPLVAMWLIQIARTSTFRTLVPFHYITGFYVFWCACSLFWTVDLDLSLNQLETFLQLYLLTLILWNELYTEKRCLIFVQAYVLGAIVVAVFVFNNYHLGNVTRWDRRATLAGIDENDIALLLSTALPMAWMLFTSTRNYVGRAQYAMKVLNLAYIPAGITAMIMTGSRGGFASLIPTVLFILVSFATVKQSVVKKLLLLTGIVGMIVAIVKYSPAQPLKRIAATFEHLSTRNVSGRWDIWQAGLEAWNTSDFSLLFGLGTGGHYSVVGRASHSTPLSVLIETGVVGLITLIAILAAILYATLSTLNKKQLRYTTFTLTLLSVWFVGVLALSWEYRKPTWIIWSIPICLAYATPMRTHPEPEQEPDKQVD